MRGKLLGVVFALVLLSTVAPAAQLPLTAKDVCLMLRMGYSPAAVTQELSARHFADTLDGVKEAQLIQAGATSELVTSLKGGTYAVPAHELARAKEELAAQAQRRALEAEKSRKFSTIYQDQLAKERAAAQQSAASATTVYNLIKGDLVRPNNGTLVHADDEAISRKKLIGFYFSAHWCAPCRKFTPQLVEYYKRVTAQHPELEIVFVSADKSAVAMEAYMRETGMPWPAIDFQKVEQKVAIRKYAGSGIPCLVVVDPSGRVVSDSYAGSQYLGPEKVLADLDNIFAGKSLPKLAQGN